MSFNGPDHADLLVMFSSVMFAFDVHVFGSGGAVTGHRQRGMTLVQTTDKYVQRQRPSVTPNNASTLAARSAGRSNVKFMAPSIGVAVTFAQCNICNSNICLMRRS